MPPAPIPLEDDPCDVIAKAMRGLGIRISELAEKSGLSIDGVQSCLNGRLDRVDWECLAPCLKLSPSALAGLPAYKPDTLPPEGLHVFTSPFGHAGVNAFAIVDGGCASVFDTGTDATPIVAFLDQHNLTLDAVYITHRHPDHTAGTDQFPKNSIIFPENLELGREISVGGGSLTVLDASGHITPSRAFYYEGLERPVCVVGDSIFAGSMGGTPDPASYQLSLKTAVENIMSLPSDTVICPGHGPLTSVALEWVHNPFLKQS